MHTISPAPQYILFFLVFDCIHATTPIRAFNQPWPSWASSFRIYFDLLFGSQHHPSKKKCQISNQSLNNLIATATNPLPSIKTHQIQCSSHQVISHTRAILSPSATHEHNTVLLNVVALAGNVGSNDSSRRELHTGRLSLARVGLLGPHDTHTQTHTLERRTRRVRQCRRDGVTCALALSDPAQHLVQRRRSWCRGAESPQHGRWCCCCLKLWCRRSRSGDKWPSGRRGEELSQD